MRISLGAIHGLSAAGCPMLSPSEMIQQGIAAGEKACWLGTNVVACSMIRECDSETGRTHFEYLVGDSPNVNILEVDPSTGRVVGYNNANADFTTATPVPVGTPIVNSQGSVIYSAPLPAVTQQQMSTVQKPVADITSAVPKAPAPSVPTIHPAASSSSSSSSAAVNVQSGFDLMSFLKDAPLGVPNGLVIGGAAVVLFLVTRHR